MNDLKPQSSAAPSERIFSSGSVKRIKYLKEERTLEVEFPNGSTYHYFEVPEKLFETLFHSPSPGKYLSLHIKDSFKFLKIK